MKIGIITYWQSNDNYGQVLQCFALQQQLKKMGHEPFLIKYAPLKKRMSFGHKLLRTLLIYPVFQKIYVTLLAKRLASKNQQRRFAEFRERNILTNGVIYRGFSDLRNNPPLADCYICGSDQVWGMLLDRDENQAFYLNFGGNDVKRVAYAASFGRDEYPVELNDKLHKMLLRFDAVSVRECTGVDICAKVGVSAIDVLDPTLLLSIKDYEPFMEVPKINTKFFYTYSLNIASSEELHWNKLLEYATKQGLTSISTTSSGYMMAKELCRGTNYVYATIPQWLGYIRNAEFVATTSFHGVAFCLILHKNFIFFPLKGTHSKGNSRVISLLDSVGLKEKIFDNEVSIKQCIEHPIDWSVVDKMLEHKRNLSVDFLRNSLL